MRTALMLIALTAFLAVTVGCQAPCDRMCDSKAAYVAACVDYTKNQLDNDLTAPAGWDVYDNAEDWWTDAYGVGGEEEFAEACRVDADGVVGGLSGEDRTITEQECEDEALVFEQAIADEGNPSCHIVP
jgi:hypothetical protein